MPHGLTLSYECYTMGFPVTGARSVMNVKKVRGTDGGDVSRFVSRPAQAVTISSFDAMAKY
jgi:hypothetical protein